VAAVVWAAWAAAERKGQIRPRRNVFRAQPCNLRCRWIVTVAAVVWAAWAAVPFIGGSVPPARRALAVFPLLLLYTSLGWLALVR